MTGLKTSSEALLVGLKKLLDDQYDVASIAKELLQNAEDAGAKSLHFARTLGDQTQEHPLLRAPALVVVNDGLFSWDNSTKIALQGLGGKGGNAGAIGKFGLGMKSVFNLTETLFYLASPTQKASKQQAQEKRKSGEITPEEVANWHFQECLNPWHGTKEHEEWDLSNPETERALHRRILQVLSGFEKGVLGEHWFALYLPLRCDALLGGGAALHALRPNADAIFDAQMSARLAALWPMLRHLRSVQVWKPDGARFALDFGWQVKKSRRRIGETTLPSQAQENEVFPIEATVQSVSAKGRKASGEEIRLFGREILLPREQILDAAMEAHWPKTYVWDEETRNFEFEREKGEPHGAAVWSETPREKSGKLHIGAGVFLPLPDAKTGEEGQSETHDLGGERSFRLLLHGYFFVDGGRRHLVLDAQNMWDTPAEKIESVWNRRLLQSATLPLVLPALTDFAAGAKLQTNELREITRALEKSGWHRRYGDSLTQNGEWVFRLSGPVSAVTSAIAKPQNSKISGAYALLAPATPFWVLPNAPQSAVAGFDGTGAVFRWFVGLRELAKTHAISWNDWPRLTQTPPAKWESDAVLAFLKGASAGEIFRTSLALRYLNDFLDLAGEAAQNPEVEARLMELGRAGLEGWKAKSHETAGLKREWTRFWGHIAPEKWLAFLPKRAEDSDAGREWLLTQMLGLKLQKLPVPPEMLEEQPASLWGLDDAAKLAHWLAGQLENWGARGKGIKPVLFRALDLVLACEGDFWGKERAFGEAKIFSTREWQGENERDFSASWQQLHQWRDQSLLWGVSLEGQSAAGRPLLKRWAKVTLGQVIYSLNESGAREVSAAIWGKDNLPTNFGPRACLSLLTQCPDLQPASYRAVLWDDIRAKPEDMELLPFQIAVRYFLHGDKTRRDDVQTPVFYAPKDAALWRSLVEAALRASGQEWRLLPAELSFGSMGDITHDFALKRLDAQGAADCLAQLEDSQIRGLRLEVSGKVARQILCECPCTPLIWRALPLHGRKGGGFCSLSDQTYWEDGVRVPEFLARKVELLEKPGGDLLEKYQSFGVLPFGPEAVLRLALSQEQPHPFAGAILDALATLGTDLPTDLKPLVQEKRWLHDDEKNGRRFAPRELIWLPHLEKLLESLELESSNWAAPHHLAPLFPIHCAWKWSEVWLPDAAQSVANLVAALEELPHDWALGELSCLESEEGLNHFLEAWDGSGQALPLGAQLLRDLRKSPTTRGHVLSVAKVLSAPASPPKLLNFLRALQNVAQASHDDEQEPEPAASRVHRDIWEDLCRSEVSPAQLCDLNLPAQNGAWKAASELCLDVNGLQPESLLHPDWADSLRDSALEKKLAKTPTASSTPVLGACGAKSDAVLRGFLAHIPNESEVIAALASILSCGGWAETLAASAWKTGAQKLVWEQLCGSEKEAARWLDYLYNYPFHIVWVDARTSQTRAHNLCGDERTFALSADFASLVVGEIRTPQVSGSGFP